MFSDKYNLTVNENVFLAKRGIVDIIFKLYSRYQAKCIKCSKKNALDDEKSAILGWEQENLNDYR